MIGVLDLNIGNIFSVSKAVEWLGFDCIRIQDAHQFDDLTHLIIPGVGYFNTAIQNLKTLQLTQALQQYIKSNRPLLGICLGMQLFAKHSVEGNVHGLHLIDGNIVSFKRQKNLRIRHIGWNTVNFLQPHPITEELKNNRDYYFVHSFHYHLHDKQNLIATTDYGYSFPSIVGINNIVGVQFHPEKSQKNGLTLLENFLRWDGQC